ncbi:hypothetical protein [Dyadobacter frigoris]|uniref:Uncharacterized protein n=1 Tax=Dyadobacter frigoris TaxID=2576211 RepID=A0A4U6D2D8_9BACT|nr:hypothetical protein [Dyadobacter frigoris]TKT88024.1 hypothetical protein FDK13_28400 [Dyadobacter frigoris]
MAWYHYFSSFWAGMFLANFVPHFTKGITGDTFPTPFSNPPGKGLSSPLINILWAFFNLTAACFLIKLGKVSTDDNLSTGLFFAGFALISIWSSIHFTRKDKV